ncbi:MAG: diphosphomevalonate decarboxylase [Bacteroidetes bacterium HGW-Bacteroidetes-13]|nr:MAG: diphosphomevalonate decarboxylase [Bacteroidetes bacterium HGW-Bacteroidetes-13]
MKQSQDFMAADYPTNDGSGVINCEAPSNIALVKYWGKTAVQIPANPSVSFTLNHSKTVTALYYKYLENASPEVSFDLIFEGKFNEAFKPKIRKFFELVETYVPFVKHYHFEIHTHNTFPHSSGIASSASSMGALAFGLIQLEKKLNPELSESFLNQKASFLARLGSGSACRSIEGPLVVWGKHAQVKESSDLFGVKPALEIHPVFSDYQDTILLIDIGEKSVSSSQGHQLMHGHPFAQNRFAQAHDQLSKLLIALEIGDLDQFIKITESEALTLHAMMMTSQPYFILMKPETLRVIEKVWAFRKETAVPLCFTLDAGANVHLLYPKANKKTVLDFIQSELLIFCKNNAFIDDEVGSGAKLL